MRSCFANTGRAWARHRALLIALVMAPSLAAAAKAGQPATPTVEAAGIQALGIQQLSQAAAQLNQPFEDAFEVMVRQEGQATTATTPMVKQSIAHCTDLLQWSDRIQDTAAPGNWPAWLYQSALCQSLQAVAHVLVAHRSGLPTTLAGLSPTRLWPASIWPNMDDDSVRAANRPGQTLAKWLKQKQWRISSNQKQGTMATLEDDSVALQLSLLARGDFDADGLEDWLLLWQAHAKGGSWAATRALIISRKPGQSALRLTWLPEPRYTDTKSPS